jgi:HK97 family phage prohead protease
VILNADGSLAGCHPTKAKANKQLAALYANEGDSMSSADQATEEQLDQRPPRDGLVRAASDKADLSENGDGPVLHGHFARFDEWTEIDSMREGNFMERIAPGAFTKTFSESDGIKVTFQHGHDPSLGDQALGKIRSLEEDKVGAAYEVDLFDGVPPLLLNGLRAGEYGSSFRFRVVREDFNREPDKSDTNPGGIPERTIKEAEVYEFGPVTYPAYAGATAAVRSLTDEYQEVKEAKRDPERWLELHETVLRALGDKPAEEVTEESPATEESAEAEPHPQPTRREPSPIYGSELEPTPLFGQKGRSSPKWRL